MTRRAPGILVVLVLAFAAPAHASAPGSDDLVEWGRTSGIAGLQDGLSVRRDGRATASPRGDDVGRRRLSHAAMTLLRRDLRAAHLERFTRPYYGDPMIADGIAVQVGRPGRPVTFHTGAHPPAAVRRLFDRLARIFTELARA